MTEIRRAVHMARTLLSIQRNEIEMIIIIIIFFLVDHLSGKEHIVRSHFAIFLVCGCSFR